MTATKPHTPEPWVELIRRKVAAMRYGSVQLTIHDGRVTQVEATEKTRLPEEQEAAPVARKEDTL
ncbi:MAG: YezD family protein [Chthoniobacteraceae bacterium]